MFRKPSNEQFAAIFDKIAPRYDKILNRYATSRRVESINRNAYGKCLEVGAGTGTISKALSKNHPVTATDISPQMVKLIKKTSNIKAYVCDAENLPFKNSEFDTVIATEVIYYLDNPEKFFREARRVLKPKGRLILTCSAKITEAYDRLRALLRQAGFKAMYFDDKNRRFVSTKQLETWLKQTGFKIKRMDRAILFPWAAFDPLNRALEKTFLKHLCVFIFVYAEKPAKD